MKRFIQYLMIWSAFSACGFDPGGALQLDERPFEAPNVDISTLYDLYRGSAVEIKVEMKISGTVTANDRSGNFFRTMIIEDGSGAVELMMGTYHIANEYPEGMVVTVSLAGLVMDSYNGIIRIGPVNDDGSGYQPGYFGHKVIIDKYIQASDRYSHMVPSVRALAELREDKCGRLVTIRGLSSADEPPHTWAQPADPVSGISPATGYRWFEDGEGGRICVITSGYAYFAGYHVPEGVADITGILMYGTSAGPRSYLLKLRDADDVKVH